jgi:hypothetical protein
MNPEALKQAKYHIQEAAKILKANTQPQDLQDFESIELVARQHLLDTVGPAMGEIFFHQESPKPAEKNGK